MSSSCKSRPISHVHTPSNRTYVCSYEIIVTLTDIVMVIEYAEGELFNYIVENGRMPESAARRFFQQMMCAIDYSHRLKVVHRYVSQLGILSNLPFHFYAPLARALTFGVPLHILSFVDEYPIISSHQYSCRLALGMRISVHPHGSTLTPPPQMLSSSRFIC
jgi:serine/threonine protein kinase